MHSKGICHMNLGVENCLVDEARERVFIGGFSVCLGVPTDSEGRR